MTLGVPGYANQAVDQTASNSCWAAVLTSALKTFALPVNDGKVPAHPEAGFADDYWDFSQCQDAVARRPRPSGDSTFWNAGVTDLGCVLDFAAIQARGAGFPGPLKRARLVSALQASKIVFYLEQSETHVVVIYAASQGPGDKLRLYVHDPNLGMKGVDFSAKRHANKPAFAARKPGARG